MTDRHLEPLDGSSVVVTGIGLATCLGRDAGATWRAILASECGMGPMSEIESALPAGSSGGQAVELPPDFCPDLAREARYLRWTVVHALRDAGLEARRAYDPFRCAVVLGTTLHGIRAGGRFLRSDDPAELGTFLAGATACEGTGGLGLHGGTITTCSACSSSLGAIVQGAMLLRTGEADLVVAGGYDAISEYAWAGFNALRLVARGALRPFCRDRQGMKVAEGYGVLVLERAREATGRRASIGAVLAGWGESADAHHLTQPHPRGDGALSAMRSALAMADIRPEDIGMVGAHATGTPDNDASEYLALARLLGEHLARVPVVAFKSHLGHTLGGAGAVELALSTLALRDRVVPACANIEPGEIEFPDLNVSTGSARSRDLRCTLNISLGFGGANTCVVLKASPCPPPPQPPRPTQPSNPPHFTDGPFVAPAMGAGRGDSALPEVWITGIGVLLPGCIGNRAFCERASERGARDQREFAGELDDAAIAPYLNARRVRRLSAYVKFTLAAAGLALRDAELADRPEAVAHACVLLGSMHGSPAFCSDYYTQVVGEGVLAANPVLFAEGVPNVGAAHLSATFGVRGACQSIIGTRTSGLDALALGALRVRAGAAEIVIVCAGEERHGTVDRGYGAVGLRAREGETSSMCSGRGFRDGCGAIAFIVESETSARARGGAPYARIGGSARGSRGTAGVVGSIASVLTRLGPTATTATTRAMHVMGSGCGTWVDRAEMLGVRRSGMSAIVGSAYERFGEHFAATPLVGIADVLATGSLRSYGLGAGGVCEPVNEFVSLCTDWTGAVGAVKIQRLGRRMDGST